MKLVRNKVKKEIRLLDGDTELFSMGFFFDEFIWSFNVNSAIMITRDVDEVFYNNLDSIMNGKYLFRNNDLSSLDNDRLVWFSDQMCDFEDIDATNKVSRLVIERVEDSFKLYMTNPFLDEFGINRKRMVAFSPMGNGYYTHNMETGSTFQDDIIINLFWKSLNSEDSKRYVKTSK